MRFAYPLRVLAVLAVLTVAVGCGGASRTKLGTDYLPDALQPGVWPGLTVYRTGSAYEGDMDGSVPAGHDYFDICRSILEDLIFEHDVTPGDVTVQVYDASHALEAETGTDGKCAGS